MVQAFCHVCFGTSLTFEHGVLVCDTCGTQTQTFEEEAEFRAGIDDTRGKRKAAGQSSAAQQSQATLLAREEERAAQQLQTAALAYVRCLQQLLQAQAECLTTRYGVSSQVTSVLRQLWLSHLPSTGMLEAIPCRPAAAALAGPAGHTGDADSEGDGNAGDEGGGEDDAVQEQQCAELVIPVKLKHLFWKLLHPQVTLQLCFLACALLRQPVTFYDILNWAVDAHLPYLALPGIAETCLSESEFSSLPTRCLQPEVSMSPLAFLNSSCQLAQHLGLQLPLVAGEALLLRQVQELALPQVVLDASLQLYFLYLTQTPRLRLTAVTKASIVTPYVWLSATILVAIKLLYGLGNAAGLTPLTAKAPGPPGGWQAWAQDAIQHLPGVSNMPLSEQDVLALGPEARQHYIQYCRHHMFAAHPTVPTLEDIQRILLGWYDATTARPVDATSAPADGAAASTEDAAQYHYQQQGYGRTSDPTQIPHGEASGAGVADYTMTGFWGITSIHRLEPQLAAVVLVLAACSRCSSGVLLDCVRTLEKQMVAVEGGVKILQRMADIS